MYPPQRQPSITEELLSTLPKTGNSQRATPIANTLTNQQFGDIPISTEGFRSGAIQDFAPTNETLLENYSKTFFKGLNTLDKFAVSTLVALPNFIDNQINQGNDRLFKAVQEPFEALESRYQSPIDLKDESRSLTDWLTPTFLGGPSHTAYGDLFEQIGLMAGIGIGTALTGGLVGLGGKALAGADVISGLNIADKAKNALTALLNPNVLSKSAQLVETLGATGAAATGLTAKTVINTIGNMARFAGLNAAQSYTEALFEGIEGEQNFIDKKKEEYLNNFGEEATGEALKNIEETARQLKDTRFGLNMAGLAITNIPFTQAFFPSKVFGDVGMLSKFGKTLNKAGDTVDKQIPWFKNSSPIVNKVANYTKLVSLAPTESVEELYQLAVEKGVDNYYTNKLNSKNFENAYDSIKESAEIGGSAIFSKEGAQSAILGAILGGGASTFHNIKDYKNFNEYLDKSTKVRQADGTTIDQTPRQRFKQDVQDIDITVEKLINPAIDPDNVALGQTLQQKVSQFSASANNAVTQANTTGMYVERAVQQQSKFDEIFPYVKKGYREVLEQKLESKFQELDAKATTVEEKAELATRKQEALQDIKTVEDYTRNVEDNFTEEFTDPVEQAIYNQLKDIAVYHRWNIDQVAKEKQDVEETFGTLYQSNEYLADYAKGVTINELVEKELKTYDGITSDIITDFQKETKQRLEKIKNLPETSDTQVAKKKAEFLSYQTRDVPVNYTLDDVVKIQNNTNKLNDRLKLNLDVINELDQVRVNSGKSIIFLNNYLKTAKSVAEEQEEKLDTQQIKDANKKRIETITYKDVTDEERQKTIELFKDKEELLEDKDILEAFENLIKSRKPKPKPVPVPDPVTPEPVTSTSTKKRRESRKKQLLIPSSEVESKIISSIEPEPGIAQEQIFETPTKDNVKIIPFQYKDENGNIIKETSHLFYDFGLIRTEDPKTPDKINNYRIVIGGKEAIQISNNKEGLLIDMNFVKDFAKEYMQDPKYAGFVQGISKAPASMPLVDFLSVLRNSDANDIDGGTIGSEIFELMQSKSFTTTKATGEDTDSRFEYEAGSKGYLFKFPKTTLEELVIRLEVENKMFKELDNANKRLKPGKELLQGKQLDFINDNFILTPFEEIVESKDENGKKLFINNVKDVPYKNSVILITRTEDGVKFEIDNNTFLNDNDPDITDERKQEILDRIQEVLNRDLREAEAAGRAPYKRGFNHITPNRGGVWLNPIVIDQKLDDVKDSASFIIQIRKKNGRDNKWTVTRTTRKDSTTGEPLYTLIGSGTTDNIKGEKTFKEIEDLLNNSKSGDKFDGDRIIYDQSVNKFQNVQETGKTAAKVGVSKMIATPKQSKITVAPVPEPVPTEPAPNLNQVLENSQPVSQPPTDNTDLDNIIADIERRRQEELAFAPQLAKIDNSTIDEAEEKIDTIFDAELEKLKQQSMIKEKFTASRDFLGTPFIMPENGEITNPANKNEVYEVVEGVTNEKIQDYLDSLDEYESINDGIKLLLNNKDLFKLKSDYNVSYSTLTDYQKNKIEEFIKTCQ